MRVWICGKRRHPGLLRAGEGHGEPVRHATTRKRQHFAVEIAEPELVTKDEAALVRPEIVAKGLLLSVPALYTCPVRVKPWMPKSPGWPHDRLS